METTATKRLAVGLICTMLMSGCGGAYRIAYTVPSKHADSAATVTTEHHHGIGPFIVGGGGLFFMLNPMSPALIDWTGPVEVGSVCPNGFSRVEHYHTMGHNFGAAFLSWLFIANWYHESNVDWTCTN